MSVFQPFFQSEIASLARIFASYANVKSELVLMSTAVKADLTTHDTTIDHALGILGPGLSTNTPYENRIALIINKGKGGNLAVAAMGTAIDAVVATLP